MYDEGSLTSMCKNKKVKEKLAYEQLQRTRQIEQASEKVCKWAMELDFRSLFVPMIVL